MLVLTRKSGETVRIGPNTVVTVLGVHGGRVRLGIACPQHVHILRGELCSPSQETEGAVEHAYFVECA